MLIRCIITDDEPIARKGIEKYVQQIPYLELVGSCSHALELDQALQQQEVELVFLDINMPYLTGIDYLKNKQTTAKFILTTAYPEYAMEGYELDVLDYLLKPISFERFFKAVEKAKAYFEHTATPVREKNFIFLKCEKRIEKIIFEEILFIESLQNYIRIHTFKERFLAHMPLKKVYEQLPQSFISPHKSYIINTTQVSAIEGNQLIIQDHKIPISKALKKEILQKIMGH